MPKEELSPQVFTGSVQPLISFLNNTFPDGICVSDIKDVLGRQYVDLVQEGGGVHGIALAGYTYVLEKMNIGFMKMAGTSAGSINTLLLNAVNTANEAELLKKDGRPKNKVTYYSTRSEKVLEYLAKKDLADLVDGHPLWRKLILNIFTPSSGSGSVKSQARAVKNAAIWSGVLLVAFLACALFLAFYNTQNGLLHFFKWATVVVAMALVAAIAFIGAKVLLVRLLVKHSEKFGVNPGKNFEDWLTGILTENGIESVDDLNEKLKNEQAILNPRFYPCGIRLSLPEMEPGDEIPELNTKWVVAKTKAFLKRLFPLEGLNSKSVVERVKDPAVNIEVLLDDLSQLLTPGADVQQAETDQRLDAVMDAFEERIASEEPTITKEIVIVSSDITHELKVEFPGMHKMYWGNDYSISPAKYVRASMSVPLFFKPFEVNFNPDQVLTIREEWLKVLKIQKNFEGCALFVDGGLLSNFPINVFYNPALPVPRKPTFGIKLEYEDESMPKDIKNLLGFAGSLVNTMRFFYDRDFAFKHDIYQKTVRSIDTGKIHWLNFNLTEKEKIELFFRGALTATIFLAKHRITDHDVQALVQHGERVRYNNKEFSIFTDEKINFRTEDTLIENVTFEWQTYKKERLLDRVSRDKRKKEIKDKASLQKMPANPGGKTISNEP